MSHILETDDGKYFVNSCEAIQEVSELSWRTCFRRINEAENLYRKTLFQVMRGSAKDAYSHQFYLSFGRSRKQNKHSEPLIKNKSKSGTTSKFHYVRRLTLFYNWFEDEGYLDPYRVPGKRYVRSPRGFDTSESVLCLSNDKVDAMLWHCIVAPETRKSLAEGYWERNIEIDFQSLRDILVQRQNLRQSPVDAINELFDVCLDERIPKQKKGLSAQTRAVLHVTFFLACSGDIYLSPAKIARSKKLLANTYPAVLRGPIIEYLAGKRSKEFCGAFKYCFQYHGNRSMSPLNTLLILAGSNYLSSHGFNPEALYKIRLALRGEKHDLRLYLQGCAVFYKVEPELTKEWSRKFSQRRSSELMEDPFALFRADANEVRLAMPVQVRNFEERCGMEFPDEFPNWLIEWTHEVERLSRRLPREDLGVVFRSCRIWFMFIFCLEKPPTNFFEVRREDHIFSADDEEKPTYISFLKRKGLKLYDPLRDLHQIFSLWISDQDSVFDNPLHPRTDWENPKHTFGTFRKAVPDLVLETLIEENARPDCGGIPYALYRNWKSQSNATTIHRICGVPADEYIPATAATIDCILTFGMRSSSARWMDSGKGDEFRIDLESLEETPNPNACATKGRRHGAIQVMRMGNGEKLLSLLLLKTKNSEVLEVPFLPRELAERLSFLQSRQDKYNTISRPIVAVEDESTIGPFATPPDIFPIFLSPKTGEKPVSPSMLYEWWRVLLRHCEEIVHQKRIIKFGSDVDRLTFFTNDGNPIWDIHSIRVSIATALLDQGVPPTIVQKLLGHSNPIMTLHYHAPAPEEIHRHLRVAFENRRLNAVRTLAEAETSAELDSAIFQITQGVVGVDGHTGGLDLAKAYLDERGPLGKSPGAMAVFSHGICPGGECAKGGEKKGNYRFGVHRDKACSRCRYRITGPAFLNGLVMNANILLMEIADSKQKERELNSEILKVRKDGGSISILETRLTQEHSFQDELWSDWAAEYQMIDRCVRHNSNVVNDDNTPAGLDQVDHHLRDGDRLELLETILEDHRLIQGSIMDIPDGLLARRNEMLYEISAKNGDVSGYLMSLSDLDRKDALDAFGALAAQIPAEMRAGITVRQIQRELTLNSTSLYSGDSEV
ncbi:site-specific integrase [Mameliella alba]|nr:site-specific integrase [Antarctobacter heliothermus]MBY6147042.1 site-specific integrase [Mameliella alba]MCA0957047.1 site-specific integrase [Mameliella alba]